MQTGTTVEARQLWPRVRSSRLVQAWLPPFVALLVLLGGWEVTVRLSDIDPTLWTPPSRVIRAIPKVLGSGLFWESALTTLKLLTLGFISAAVLGIGFGLPL